MKRIGLIVNPIAGIGGRVGLKGSDGIETIELARKLGAIPESPAKTLTTLKRVKNNFGKDVRIITYPGSMGETEAIEAGFKPEVIGELKSKEPNSSLNVTLYSYLSGS